MRLQLRLLVAAMAMIFGIAGQSARAVDLLYVTLVNNTIVRYDTTGNDGTVIAASAAVFASSNLNSPFGLAFDASGNLYAANSGNNTISKFAPSGTFLTSWSTPAIPRLLAFQPAIVPEPSTYSLGAIASGVMAFVARRRKAKRA